MRPSGCMSIESLCLILERLCVAASKFTKKSNSHAYRRLSGARPSEIEIQTDWFYSESNQRRIELRTAVIVKTCQKQKKTATP
ncbi:hypothetical protein B0H17DRAFT_1107428 [Mycena rosella]|uniref:Secreted protein n=1 Tax=Mycena rosella TaxID=1033263 RepID=A0AAD7FPB6_MYCRO|nr:hypothetical protein B0H17DRAFT_1107428 [Mycena rosella]